MTAAHPAIKTISMGATIWGRTPGGVGTISGSRRRRGAVLSQGGVIAADGSITHLKFGAGGRADAVEGPWSANDGIPIVSLIGVPAAVGGSVATADGCSRSSGRSWSHSETCGGGADGVRAPRGA